MEGFKKEIKESKANSFAVCSCFINEENGKQ